MEMDMDVPLLAVKTSQAYRRGGCTLEVWRHRRAVRSLPLRRGCWFSFRIVPE